jgi:hypothetical protein
LSEAIEILLTLLLLLPLAAGVGILFFAGIRRAMRSTLKQNPPKQSDPATEIERIRAQDRADARALYERITRDKLDIIKTALTMGYDRKEMRELDARLEDLIGSDKLHALLEEKSPASPPLKSELLDADLSEELARIKREGERQ